MLAPARPAKLTLMRTSRVSLVTSASRGSSASAEPQSQGGIEVSVSVRVPPRYCSDENQVILKQQAEQILALLASHHFALGDSRRQRLIEALVEATPLRGPSERELRLRARGTELVLQGTEWLTAEQVAEFRSTVQHARAPAVNRANLANRWKGDSRVFAISRGGKDYFPRYVFDEAFEPVPAVRRIVQLFGGRSGWALAAWFESPSSFLGGRRPRELLHADPERVIAAAEFHNSPL